MYVSDHRVHQLESRQAVDAGTLEIYRIDVHPDVRPADSFEDVTTDFRMQRRAIVIFEIEAHIGMPVGQPQEVLADGLERIRRSVGLEPDRRVGVVR